LKCPKRDVNFLARETAVDKLITSTATRVTTTKKRSEVKNIVELALSLASWTLERDQGDLARANLNDALTLCIKVYLIDLKNLGEVLLASANNEIVTCHHWVNSMISARLPYSTPDRMRLRSVSEGAL